MFEHGQTPRRVLVLSAVEQKFYLQQRALPVSGTHSDLAARAHVAFEQQILVKETAEDFAETLKNEHKRLLAKYEIEKDPLEMTDWSEDPTKWPKTNLGNIFGYILSKKAFSTDYIGQYKVRKAYSYFKSGFVHQVYSQSISSGNIFWFLLK